jgi:glycosyltransferase involved in cell wall biosynthesis
MFPGINVEDENNTKLRMSSNSDAIILSSLDAKKDLISISGPAVNNQRISVLNFVSQPSELEINPHEFNEFLKLYDIPDKFFLCPNQFWKHKNHEVIIEAIRELKCQGIDVCVIMTGNPVDYRLEGTPYINHLMELVSAYNLTNQIKILGLVDYKFLGYLMHKSIALINPSKFEGWSSSVEEAKSLGKQVILSSIEVHHEQAPNHGYFFKSNDAHELAGILSSTWHEFSPDDDKNRMIAAEKLLHERTVEFGNKYLRLILDTIETKR